MILTVSDVHSCVILNENLLPQFIKSLQPSEGSRTDELINLLPARRCDKCRDRARCYYTVQHYYTWLFTVFAFIK